MRRRQFKRGQQIEVKAKNWGPVMLQIKRVQGGHPDYVLYGAYNVDYSPRYEGNDYWFRDFGDRMTGLWFSVETEIEVKLV